VENFIVLLIILHYLSGFLFSTIFVVMHLRVNAGVIVVYLFGSITESPFAFKCYYPANKYHQAIFHLIQIQFE